MAFIYNSDEIIDKLILKIKSLDNPDILSGLIPELEKIFHYFLEYGFL